MEVFRVFLGQGGIRMGAETKAGNLHEALFAT